MEYFKNLLVILSLVIIVIAAWFTFHYINNNILDVPEINYVHRLGLTKDELENDLKKEGIEFEVKNPNSVYMTSYNTKDDSINCKTCIVEYVIFGRGSNVELITIKPAFKEYEGKVTIQGGIEQAVILEYLSNMIDRYGKPVENPKIIGRKQGHDIHEYVWTTKKYVIKLSTYYKDYEYKNMNFSVSYSFNDSRYNF